MSLAPPPWIDGLMPHAELKEEKFNFPSFPFDHHRSSIGDPPPWVDGLMPHAEFYYWDHKCSIFLANWWVLILINLFKKTILYIKSPSLFFYKVLSKLKSKYDSFAKSKDEIDLKAFNDREFRLNTPAMVELKNGMKLWGDLGDYGVSRAAMFSTYEPSETNFFKQIIPTIPEGLIIDIGANIGWFTLLFSQFPREIIAIEPRPNNFEYLKKNRESNNLSNVEIINAAVSDSEGEGIVFVLPSAGNSGGTHFKSDPSEEFINELNPFS